jgi:hypothetical protein
MAASDDIHGLIGRLGDGFGPYRRFEAPSVPVPSALPRATPAAGAPTLDELLRQRPLAPAHRAAAAAPGSAGPMAGASAGAANPPLEVLFERLCQVPPGEAAAAGRTGGG